MLILDGATQRRHGAVVRLWLFSLDRRLEDDLLSELQLSWRVGAGDGAETSVGDVAIRRLVVHLVENIECLGPEVELGRFAPEIEGLVEAEVRVVVGVGT